VAMELPVPGSPDRKRATSWEKRVLRSIQTAQCGKPRSPPRGSSRSSPDQATSLSAPTTASPAMSSGSGGLSSTVPCLSVRAKTRHPQPQRVPFES
jgi:hypothetical protein